MIREFFNARVFELVVVLWVVSFFSLTLWGYTTKKQHRFFFKASRRPLVAAIVSVLLTVAVVTLITLFN